VLLAPAMLAGNALGRRLALGLPRERFLRIMGAVVLCAGCALVWRYVRL